MPRSCWCLREPRICVPAWERSDLRSGAAAGSSVWGGSTNAPAAEAIRRPLRDEDITITDGALEHIVRESDAYPFFVQLWGDAVWARARAESRERIGSEDVSACRVVFERQRNRYYSQRYDELKKRRLLRPARAVAEAFESRSVISDSELDSAIRRGFGEAAGDDEAEAAEQEFRHLGFVWRTDGMPDWEPGIPSLMDYILRTVPAR